MATQINPALNGNGMGDVDDLGVTQALDAPSSPFVESEPTPAPETAIPELGEDGELSQQAPDATPKPDELTQLRADNTRLTQAAQEQQRQAEYVQLQNAAAQYAQVRINHWTTQGHSDEDAHRLGVAEARSEVDAYRAQQAELKVTRMELSQQYGVPIEQLSGHKDEISMRHYAEQYANTTGPQAKVIKDLTARLAAIEKGQVPAQPYNAPGGGRPTGGNQAIWDAFGRRTPWSPQVRKAGEALGYL